MKKKQLASSLIGFFGLFVCTSSSKAWDFYDVVYSGNSSLGNHVYGVDSSTGEKTLLTTKLFSGNSYEAGTSFVDGKNRLSIVSGSVVHVYDPVSDSWNDITVFSGKAFGATPISQTTDGAIAIGDDADSVVQIGTGSAPVSVGADGVAVDGSNLIKETSGTVEIGGSSAVVEIGTGDNPTTISSEGVSVGGSNLIKRSGGTVSIGENSLKLREQGGRQQMWATDANNNAININVTEGSKLLVEGVEVDPTAISDNTSAISSNDTDISSLQSLVKSSGSEVQIGSDSNGVTISSSAVKVGGENLISKRSDGSVHIGKNSLVLKESGGRQQMWATDASGNSIDIDITNGSRLLINGRDVEKSIDNVGALSAALGSVPAISADSQFTCGFGAGTHSSAYALSGGCASRVSDRVSVNAALATVINNHSGDSDDNLSARAGFTFKLGKIDDSPKVAARKTAELHDKVGKLEARNESLLALLQAQASRLERLEQLASGQLSLLGDRASSD